MTSSNLTKLVMAVGTVAALAVPCVSHAQVSKLSEREARLIYSRAFEAILWASPMLAVNRQAEANRDLGAGNTDVIYTGEKPDYQWGGLTYKVQSPYWVRKTLSSASASTAPSRNCGRRSGYLVTRNW